MTTDKARIQLREKNEEERKHAASATPALRARGRGGAADMPNNRRRVGREVKRTAQWRVIGEGTPGEG